MQRIITAIKDLLTLGAFSAFRPTSVIEVIIIAFLVYHLMLWIKNTRAWTLFKGILVVGIFALVAYFLQLNTILWIFKNSINVLIIGLLVIFQPELRRALEQLGRKNFVSTLFGAGLFSSDGREQKNSLHCINEVIQAAYEMSKVKTGALIVLEQDVSLSEFERTGIPMDSLVSSQLLINIFEHNTPLHDGAVFIRNSRITAATCYLPLTDNTDLSKALGTRHRAAVGISEVSDSLTIVVSEETGGVSLAREGHILRDLSKDALRREILEASGKKHMEQTKFGRLKGFIKNEKKASK